MCHASSFFFVSSGEVGEQEACGSRIDVPSFSRDDYGSESLTSASYTVYRLHDSFPYSVSQFLPFRDTRSTA